MKSILHQLQKYDPPKPDDTKDIACTGTNAIYKNDEQDESYESDDELFKLAARIVGSEGRSHSKHIWHKLVSHVASLLVDMPDSPYCDVLFSKEILGIYHCYYKHKSQVVSENRTDRLFMSFLQQKDPIEFQKQFESAVDDAAKRLAVMRIAIATSEQNSMVIYNNSNTTGNYDFCQHKKEDQLPLKFRQPALGYLGINNITAVSDLQYKETKHASLDQIILGRVGYIMFWNWNNNASKFDVPLLAAQQKMITSE